MTEKIVIFEYTTCTVNVHDFPKDGEAEDVVEELGYDSSNCQWMVTDNLTINIK